MVLGASEKLPIGFVRPFVVVSLVVAFVLGPSEKLPIAPVRPKPSFEIC